MSIFSQAATIPPDLNLRSRRWINLSGARKTFGLLTLASSLCLPLLPSSTILAQESTGDPNKSKPEAAEIGAPGNRKAPTDLQKPESEDRDDTGRTFDIDPIEELDSYEEAKTPEELALELTPGAVELREKFQQGIHLGLGASKPWTTAHFEYHYKIRSDLWTSAFYGIGGSNLSGKWQQSDYDLSVDSSHFGFSGRYYPTDSLPVFTSALLALSKWSGRIKATGIDIAEEEPALDQISTSFHAQGLSAAIAIGCSGLWENGFFLEYTFVGIGLSKITGETIARNRNQSTKILEDSLENPLGFGFLNIAAGYFF